MNHRLQEQIDNYHSGRMTPEEQFSFERELAKDPSIRAESDLQRDIINGLNEYRKIQLKTRLSAINVNPTWIEFVQQSTLMKSFGGVAIATLIGAGVFFFAEPNKDTSNELGQIVIDAPEDNSISLDWVISPAKATSAVVEKSSETNPSKVIENPVQKTKVTTTIAKTQNFTPVFSAPDARNIKDEEALKISELDELPAGKEDNSSEQAIDVETEITENISVKYKYYDGKLFLSGDFDRAPYEILEINSANGRRIYVKYLNKYYKVEITDKLEDLPEVMDEKIIEELKLLRQNK